MSDSIEEAPDHRHLGLLANPFVPVVESSDSIGVRLAVRAAALRVMGAISRALDDPDHKPVVVEKSADIPSYYDVAALSEIMSSLSSGDPVSGVLSAYIPIDMMRLGRVRAALSVIAERVSWAEPDVMIARAARGALAEPDRDLREWTALEAVADIEALIARIDADEAAFTAEVFGERVDAREGADDPEVLMRVSTARQGRLETDPEEGDEPASATADEEATDDPLGEVFVTPLAEGDVAEPGDQVDSLVAQYVLAYVRAHLSPVVARGIQAYSAQGTSSMAQELKVTKAPTKTLSALLKLAKTRFRAGVLMYDRFEMWENAPTDLRMKIIATLTQQRWALKDDAVLLLFITRGDALELRESFAAATAVPWSFAEVDRVFSDGVAFDREAALGWIDSASLQARPEWAEALVDAVPEDVTIEAGCQALADELEAAAAESREPRATAVAAALESAERVQP